MDDVRRSGLEELPVLLLFNPLIVDHHAFHQMYESCVDLDIVDMLLRRLYIIILRAKSSMPSILVTNRPWIWLYSHLDVSMVMSWRDLKFLG